MNPTILPEMDNSCCYPENVLANLENSNFTGTQLNLEIRLNNRECRKTQNRYIIYVTVARTLSSQRKLHSMHHLSEFENK